MAAAATAIRLSALSLRVRLLVRDVPVLPGVEAIPRRALELFDVLGEADLPAESGAVEVQGPAHHWHRAAGRVPAPFIHVDRASLAEGLLARALMRGATVRRVRHLPRPEEVAESVVALVDGTGRAAAWSRPVQVQGHAVAWQFRAPATADMGGRVVREDGWWAYRLGHTSACWLGIVTDSGRLTDSVVEAAAGLLGLSPGSLVPQGRRPAWVQLATSPVAGRRVSVGDAALAHDPIAGQGIRFALGSAIAAASTVATWADDPSRRDVATAYYRNLVEAEEVRHRAALEHLADADGADADGDAEPVTEPSASPVFLRCGAEVVETPLSIDGHVELGPALRLPSGATTRWAGTFDLLELARITPEPTPRLLVLAGLQELGLDLAAARALLSWALENGVLVDTTGARKV